LEEGLAVYASAWLDKPKHSGKTKRGRNVADIDIGLYLDSRWASEHVLVTPGLRLSTGERVRGPRAILYPWEDWGVPEDLTLFKLVLQWLMEEIRVGKTVEVGCMGGHGRTGTVLGCLLILQGRPWEEVIDMVRDGYCEDAIESRSQLRLLRSLA
jgi:protein-tyrosine phosphatase